MLKGTGTAIKAGVLIYAGILCILAFCFCPPDGTSTGKVSIHRHVKCTSVYIIEVFSERIVSSINQLPR